MFGMGIPELLVFIALALAQCFWIWMLLSALIYETAARDRVFWVLVIFFTWILGALAYSVMRAPPRRPGSEPAPTP